jgi:DNA polymerase III delta subunit
MRLACRTVSAFLPPVPSKKQLPGPGELQKRFKQPDFRFLYFTGEEEFRKRRAAAHWESLLRQENPTLKIKKLFGSELDWERLANHLSCLSLFGEVQLFWIFEADKLRTPVRDSLAAHLQSHPGPHYLLFWGEEVDARLSFTKLFLEKNLLFEFKTFSSPQQIAGWLTGYASERGLAFPPETARMLVEKLGDDLSVLASEVDKLALSYDQLPSAGTLEKEISSRRNFAPWDLTGALAKKDAGQALFILQRLRDEGTSPGTIFYQLSDHYSKILAFVLSGDFSQKTYYDWGFYGYLHPSLTQEAKTYSKKRILATVAQIAEAERQTRFEKIPSDLILENLTVRLCL